MVQVACSATVDVQSLLLPELGRPLFCRGALSLLDRPIVTLAGAHKALPGVRSFGRRLSRSLAIAGFAVAAAADTPAGQDILASAAEHGAVVGMLYRSLTASFNPPVVAPADASLWISIFQSPEHVWVHGIDAADRALGTLSTAVVVLDNGGVPDAFYIAESAVRAGRLVFFPRAAAVRWPARLGTAAPVGASIGTILDTLTHATGQNRPLRVEFEMTSSAPTTRGEIVLPMSNLK